jgi:tetratricopeptide (TPR) repeat protein
VIHLFANGRLADSLITIALDYCRQTNDTSLLEKTLFASGHIYLGMGKPDKAVKQYLELSTFPPTGQKWRQVQCLYLISKCYMDMKAYEKALFYSKEMLSYTDEGNPEDALFENRYVASIYMEMNRKDSALTYYHSALREAMKLEDPNRYTSHLFSEMALLYASRKEYEKAVEYIRLSMQHRASRKDIPLFNLIKAKVHFAMNERDSARIYLIRSIESSDNQFVTIAAYELLSGLYEKDGNYELAFYKLADQNTLLNNQKEYLNQAVLTQKYQEEQLKNENNELKLAKKEREIYLLSAAVLFLSFSLFLWVLFSEAKKKKRIAEQLQRVQMLKDQAKITEQENRLLKQEKELSLLREKAASLRESLFRKMSVSEKIPSLDTCNGDHVRTSSNKRIHMEQSDWDELIQTVDDVFNRFASRLRKNYPDLTSGDIGFCCLLKINVSMQDLVDIYCISKAGITKRKTRMKKEKFYLTDDTLTLDDFLLEY